MLSQLVVAKGEWEGGDHKLRGPAALTVDAIRILVALKKIALLTGAARMRGTVLTCHLLARFCTVGIETDGARVYSGHCDVYRFKGKKSRSIFC
jgi:hypothetical protein